MFLIARIVLIKKLGTRYVKKNKTINIKMSFALEISFQLLVKYQRILFNRLNN